MLWGFFSCCFLGKELGSPKAIAQVPTSLPFLGKLCCQGKLLVGNRMLTWGVKPPGCPLFFWCWKEHLFLSLPIVQPLISWQRCDVFAMGFASMHEMETSNHHVCLLFLSSWVLAVAGSQCFCGEMEEAARFGLVPEACCYRNWLWQVTGKRHLLGSEWEGLGMSPVSAQNSTQEMGKGLSSQPVPLLLCTLVISPSGLSLCYCRDKILQILQCSMHAVSARHLGFEKAVVIFWCTWFLDRAFLWFKADISVVGEIVFFPKVQFHLLCQFLNFHGSC